MHPFRIWALVLGGAGWLAWTVVWWAGYHVSPHQTVIYWQSYGLWEWLLEGVLFHALVAASIWALWRK